MKVLFVLGFPNPFLGAGWTKWRYDMVAVEVFSPKDLRMAGFKSWKDIPII